LASSSVIAAVGGAAFKTLLSGGPPDPGTWGSVASALINEVLRAEDQTANALARIEAKVDRQMNLAYVGPLRVAAAHLRDANARHRTPKKRERMLADARGQVMTARAAAPDEVAAARAEWSLAVIWAASASIEDSRAALERGAALATRAAMTDVGAYRQPPRDQVEERARQRRSPIDRIGLGGRRAEEKAIAELRAEAAERLGDALAVLDRLQAELRVLGLPAEQRPGLQVVGGDGPARLVRLVASGGPGVNVAGDLRVRLLGAVGDRSDDLEIHLELAAGSDGPDLAVVFHPLHRRQLQGPPAPTGRVGQHLWPVPLGLPGILSTRLRAATKRVVVPAGQTSRGWASLVCTAPRAGTPHHADHVARRGFVAVQLTISPLVRQARGLAGLGVDPGSLDLVLPLPARSGPRAPKLIPSAFDRAAGSKPAAGTRIRPRRRIPGGWVD
jgi:hypothetical protein